jgi:hypothetical protein
VAKPQKPKLEKSVFRRIIGSDRDRVSEVWRNFHNEEFHSSYSSLNTVRMTTSRRMSWIEHVRNIYKVLARKTEGRKPLEIPRLR